MSESQPKVSVVVPARRAVNALPTALASIAAQTYPHIVEVIVAAADEQSARVAAEHSARVVDNPIGITPAGLNRGIAVASGEIIVRCDAHSVLPPGYVERAVETMLRTGADNVGGMQVPVGTTAWEQAIGAAMSSLLGAGDARYRIGGEEGPVETVYLGVYKKATLDSLGGFNEDYIRNQDYELNHRIIKSGGVVWFDPELAVEYRPRGSLRELARQYFSYGRGKRHMARNHQGSLKWRQLAAPGIVIGLGLSIVVSVFWPWALVLPLLYLMALEIYAAVVLREEGYSVPIAAALATMHISWGIGFLTG